MKAYKLPHQKWSVLYISNGGKLYITNHKCLDEYIEILDFQMINYKYTKDNRFKIIKLSFWE